MKPEDLARFQDSATRPRRTVPIILDGTLRQRIEDVQYEIDRAVLATPSTEDRRLGTKSKPLPDTTVLDVQLDALYAEAADATLHVLMQGVSTTAWRTLYAQHPPRENEPADQKFGANTDTIREAVVRATVLGHVETVEATEVHPLDVDWLLSFVSDAQMDELVDTAIAVCRGDVKVPLRRRRSATQTSGAE